MIPKMPAPDLIRGGPVFRQDHAQRPGKKIPSVVGPRTGRELGWEEGYEDSEQTSETAARQGGWGGRGVSTLTGAGTKVGAKTNDSRK